MPGKKFEGGELGEGQGTGKFQTEEERSAQEAVGDAIAEPEALTVSQAEEIMGDAILGPKEVLAVFGDLPNPVPLITFTKEELRQAKQRGQMLVLFTDQCASRSNESPVAPITLKELDSQFPGAKLNVGRGDALGVHSRDAFYTHETPRVGWRLVSTPETFGTSSVQRGENMYIGLKNLKSEYIPKVYQHALEEYEAALDRTRNRGAPLSSDACRRLSLLTLFTPLAVEVAYLRILIQKLELLKDKKKFGVGNYVTYTLSLTDKGEFVRAELNPSHIFVYETQTKNPELRLIIAFQSSGRDEEETFA